MTSVPSGGLAFKKSPVHPATVGTMTRRWSQIAAASKKDFMRVSCEERKTQIKLVRAWGYLRWRQRQQQCVLRSQQSTFEPVIKEKGLEIRDIIWTERPQNAIWYHVLGGMGCECWRKGWLCCMLCVSSDWWRSEGPWRWSSLDIKIQRWGSDGLDMLDKGCRRWCCQAKKIL